MTTGIPMNTGIPTGMTHSTHHMGTDDGGDMHFGTGPAGVHVAGMSQARLIEIETDILSKNDRYAAENRAFFKGRQVLALNLVSSPGPARRRFWSRPSRCWATNRSP
jgi:hydrogenase nickel incorporation protein HypB